MINEELFPVRQDNPFIISDERLQEITLNFANGKYDKCPEVGELLFHVRAISKTLSAERAKVKAFMNELLHSRYTGLQMKQLSDKHFGKGWRDE